jgi:hypothetical protein
MPKKFYEVDNWSKPDLRLKLSLVTFILWKITRMLLVQQLLKLKKNTNLKSLIFFDAALTRYKNNQILQKSLVTPRCAETSSFR